MERFEEAIYKQRDEINERMTEMFILLKEYTKEKAQEKVLVREEVSKPVTKYVNAVSLVNIEDDKGEEYDEVANIWVVKQSEVLEEKEIEEDVDDDNDDDELDRSGNDDQTRWGKYVDRLMEIPSQPIGYYLKHEINKKTVEGLVNNHKYNDALLKTRLGKMDSETYKSLPIRPMYDAILKKTLARKKEREGNFVISCSIGELKYMNALADQGSDVNIIPLTMYNKLTSEKPIGTNIRLSLANHSYVYPVGIAKDVLVDVAGFVYPVDFVILDIKEDEYMPLVSLKIC
ncbi:MAK10-like protein [Tanacetum coccineum]